MHSFPYFTFLALSYLPANAQRGAVPWEGSPGSILVHFLKNDQCQEAYKAYFCYLNFPRCDEAQNSLLLCKSTCESFFRACRYPAGDLGNMSTGMWRCGPAEWSGGYSSEVYTSLDANGMPVYARAPFPGLPFDASNAPGGCTPGVAGGSSTAALSAAAAIFALALAVLAAYT